MLAKARFAELNSRPSVSMYKKEAATHMKIEKPEQTERKQFFKDKSFFMKGNTLFLVILLYHFTDYMISYK